MIAPYLFLLIGLVGTAIAFILPGAQDLLLVTAPTCIASLYLVLTAKRAKPKADWIVIDGSNVMHWKNETPSFDALHDVISRTVESGRRPYVFFDANAGYKLAGKYQHDLAMAAHLSLSKDQVTVVPKGTVADQYILKAARDLNAKVISNDKFRDWADSFPEVSNADHMVRGGYKAGALWLQA